MLILEKMLVFLILMLVGLLLAKVRVLDEPSSRKLSAIVLYVANPALLIGSSQTEHNIPGAQLLTTLLIALLMFAVLIATAAVLPRLFRLGREEGSAYALMAVFSNIGYLGIPLINEVLGSQAILYASVFILVFNVLIYTYGVMILQRAISQPAQHTASWRKLINPGVLSGIVAVVFYLLKIKLPDVINVPLGYLSNLTAPLSMLLIGAALAQVSFLSFFSDWKLLIFSVLKLLVLPILLGFVLKLAIGGGDLLGVCIIMMSAPVGSMTVMMAQQYGGDYTLLSRGVTLTTVLCIATIPIVFAVLL
ncbi:MAG TPA: AEC family transporter [Candidatus Limiplasma sp.]|nr:AEC family transporter [Candidatus Limiplasma sp.]HRX09847.1 AEC family transporter [Candidatus Limiplasma sp.]